jgi:hypothetical protein
VSIDFSARRKKQSAKWVRGLNRVRNVVERFLERCLSKFFDRDEGNGDALTSFPGLIGGSPEDDVPFVVRAHRRPNGHPPRATTVCSTAGSLSRRTAAQWTASPVGPDRGAPSGTARAAAQGPQTSIRAALSARHSAVRGTVPALNAFQAGGQ